MAKTPSKSKRSMPPSQLDLFPKHSHLIAKIIGHWNFVEEGLITLLALVMHTEAENILRMMRAIRTSSIRLDVIEAGIVESMPPETNELHDYIVTLLSRCRNGIKRRNTYAHSHYYSKDERRLWLVNPRQLPSDKGYERVVTIKELKEAYTEISNLGYEIANVCVAFGAQYQERFSVADRKSRTNVRSKGSEDGM